MTSGYTTGKVSGSFLMPSRIRPMLQNGGQQTQNYQGHKTHPENNGGVKFVRGGCWINLQTARDYDILPWKKAISKKCKNN
jgi:hypothetical protein